MFKRLLTVFSWMGCLTAYSAHAQVIAYHAPNHEVIYRTGSKLVPEHGFLPGKKFPFYPARGQYHFSGLRVRVQLYDDRIALALKTLHCSDVPLTNTSELSSSQSIFKIGTYLDSIFTQSGIQIDSTAQDLIEVRLEAFDARLFGFGYVKVHGLCQMKISYGDFAETYCTDIVDGDPHAPVGSRDLITRKTATRFMASASVRENLEKFLEDLKSIRK